MNRLVKNVSSILVSQVGMWVVSIVLLIVVPGQVGDDAFGQLTFAMVYIGFFELFALFGTATFLIKQISRQQDQLGRYVRNGLHLTGGWGATLAVVAVAIAALVGFHGQQLALIVVFAVGMFLNAMTSPLMAGMHGMQRMAKPAMWLLIRSYATGVVGLAVLHTTDSIVAYAAVCNLTSLIPLVLAYLTLRPHIRGHAGFEFPLWRTIIVGGFPYFVASALLAIHGKSDIPLLRAMSGDQTVGWYGVAYQWVGMPALFAAAVATAFFPSLSAEGQHLTPMFAEMANRAVRLVTFVATPAAIGIALVSEQVLHLVYGAEFSQSAVLVQILALHIPLVGMNIVLSVVAISADRQKRAVQLGLAAAVFNPLANLVAIPLAARFSDNAAIGAATVTVLTEVLLTAGFVRIRPPGVLDGTTASRLIRTGLAALAMVPAVVLLHGTPLVVQIASGVVVYACAVVGLRVVTPFEMRRAAEAIRPRRPAEVPA